MAVNTVLIIYAFGSVAVILLMLSLKWVIFSLKLLFANARYKKANVGLLFNRNMGNNFALPEIICIKDNRSEKPDKINMFDRAMFSEGTFFGYPFAFIDSEDTKTSYGLYKVQLDEEGRPMTHKIDLGEVDEAGNPELIETDLPVLHKLKSSVTVSPHLMKTVIAAAALSKAVEEFVKKNQYILYAAAGACILAGGALFFSYNNQNSIATFCGEQLLNTKNAIITACTNSS